MATNKTLQMDLKVGVFVTIGLGLILFAILILGGAESLLTRQSHFQMHFKSVEGLIPGAKVVLGGLSVGTVEQVDFDQKARDIRVGIIVNRKYEGWIKEDTQAEISTQGVLGDKYIALNPGTEESPLLKPGADITTRPVKDISQMFSKGDQLMVNLNVIASCIERLLRSFEVGNRNEIFFQGMASTAKNLSEATVKLNRELDQLKLRSSIGHLHDILEKINNGTGTLGALINDPNLYYDARSLMGGANRNRIVRNLVRQTVKDAEEAEAKENKSAPKKK